jgi:hypothetical protein
VPDCCARILLSALGGRDVQLAQRGSNAIDVGIVAADAQFDQPAVSKVHHVQLLTCIDRFETC